MNLVLQNNSVGTSQPLMLGSVPISQTVRVDNQAIYDEESIKRILAAKNAAPVAVLKGGELMDWLNK
jgi:hypothetical protein